MFLAVLMALFVLFQPISAFGVCDQQCLSDCTSKCPVPDPGGKCTQACMTKCC